MAASLFRLLNDNPLTGLLAGLVERGRPLPGSVHQFSFDGLGGGRIDLESYRGQPLMITNTASKCGFTPQYQGLEMLYRCYGKRGLMIVGVPSNDFAEQEPGEAGEIAEFCARTYGVSFPMAAKVSVVGAKAHPLFRWFAANRPGIRPRWNFHKYLFDGAGQLVLAAPSITPPEAPKIVQAMEALL